MLVDLLSWRSIKIRIFTLNVCCNDVLWYCNVQRKVWLCKVIILVIPLHLLFNLFDQTIYLEACVSLYITENKGEILGLEWKPMFAFSSPLQSWINIKLRNYNYGSKHGIDLDTTRLAIKKRDFCRKIFYRYLRSHLIGLPWPYIARVSHSAMLMVTEKSPTVKNLLNPL